MKIAVTGGAGFIGSHIAELALLQGHEVTVIDSLCHGHRSNLPSEIPLLTFDVRDPALTEVIRQLSPEVVIHHAAQISVPESIEHPLHDASVNILGTLNLLEACVRTGVRKIIYPASASMFAKIQYLPIDESHPISFLSPYGVSKQVVEHYLQVYHALYGLDYTILRYSNVYGPRQDASGEGGVVSIFSQAMLHDSTPVIFGDGQAARDFLFVNDAAQANLRCLTGFGQETIHVCTGVETSILQLYELIAGFTGFSKPPHFGPPRPGDIERSFLSTKKMDQLLTLPVTPIRQGLSLTIQQMKTALIQTGH